MQRGSDLTVQGRDTSMLITCWRRMLQLLSVTAGTPDVPNTAQEGAKALGEGAPFCGGSWVKATGVPMDTWSRELCGLGTPAATSEWQRRLGSVPLSWESIQEEHRNLGTAVHPGCCLEKSWRQGLNTQKQPRGCSDIPTLVSTLLLPAAPPPQEQSPGAPSSADSSPCLSVWVADPVTRTSCCAPAAHTDQSPEHWQWGHTVAAFRRVVRSCWGPAPPPCPLSLPRPQAGIWCCSLSLSWKAASSNCIHSHLCWSSSWGVFPPNILRDNFSTFSASL